MLQVIPHALLSVLYPQDCRICKNSVEDASDGVVCGDCWLNTLIFAGDEILCKKCGAFLRESESLIAAFCHRCDDHFYDSARAVGIYDNALTASILYLKQTPHIAPRLRKLLINAFEISSFSDDSLIIPVPLSGRRLLERGFNQAGLIATVVAKYAKMDLDEHSLIRTVHTPIHRAAMDRKARERSVKNAFRIVRPRLIDGRNILLVDDVLTSGATVSNCAKALKKSGASEVNVLTLARAA